jgi:hypothetical protein
MTPDVNRAFCNPPKSVTTFTRNSVIPFTMSRSYGLSH